MDAMKWVTSFVSLGPRIHVGANTLIQKTGSRNPETEMTSARKGLWQNAETPAVSPVRRIAPASPRKKRNTRNPAAVSG